MRRIIKSDLIVLPNGIFDGYIVIEDGKIAEITNKVPEGELIDATDNDQPPPLPEYFITTGPLTHWRYSPEGCSRVIERHFERV